tara:strand:- start:1534 stop:1941 length:408 start_codon:yes stop_codon:yes gene_type:complete
VPILMATKKSHTYKDITLDFVPNPVTGDLGVLKNERAIMRSVRNLVQTRIRERFYSDVGSEVSDLLFGFCDVATGGVIADEVRTLLATFEPRIANITVNATPRPDLNEYEMLINYEIVGQERAVQGFEFILEATR